MENIYLDAIASRRDSLQQRAAMLEKQLDEFKNNDFEVTSTEATLYGQNYWKHAEIVARLTVYGSKGQLLTYDDPDELKALLVETQIKAGKEIAKSCSDKTGTQRFILVARAHECLYLIALLDTIKGVVEVFSKYGHEAGDSDDD